MQRRSCRELAARRAAAVAAVREHADLEFVNGGGTGSVARDRGGPAVTELDRRLRPVRADAVRRLPAWRPEPAAFFALSVVRRPAPGIATVLGGGWIASGAGRPRPPARPALPAGLS